jgi:hypothetical protein
MAALSRKHAESWNRTLHHGACIAGRENRTTTNRPAKRRSNAHILRSSGSRHVARTRFPVSGKTVSRVLDLDSPATVYYRMQMTIKSDRVMPPLCVIPFTAACMCGTSGLGSLRRTNMATRAIPKSAPPKSQPVAPKQENDWTKPAAIAIPKE